MTLCSLTLRSFTKNDVDKLLTAAENGTLLNRDQVAKVNIFLVSYILLLANRPSAAEELTVDFGWLVVLGLTAR